MKSTIQDKSKLVNSVFTEVNKKYDLMNDIMSLGIHRIWKEKLIDWMNPQPNSKLIDVASGTGDIAKLFLERSNYSNQVTCVEPNLEMLKQGKIKLKSFKTINWINSNAEKIPVKDLLAAIDTGSKEVWEELTVKQRKDIPFFLFCMT